MNPRAQWAQTSDGVSIGFTTAGSGDALPVLWLPPLSWSHARLGWDIPVFGRRYELLARRRPFAVMDFRGQGLSDRNVQEISPDALVRDVEAVIEKLGWNRFGLFGVMRGCMVALSYAHRHPAQVAALVLDSGVATLAERPPGLPSLSALRRSNWDLFVEAFALLAAGWERAEEGQQLATYFHECTTQAAVEAMEASFAGLDLGGILADIPSPTLVIRRSDDPWSTHEGARHLATAMPEARMVLFAGRIPVIEEIAPDHQVVEEFLDEVAAMQGPVPIRSAAPPARLTAREIDVLRLVVAGRTNKEIASELVLSPRTVARHIANIYDKIDTRGKAEATAYAIRHGLVT